MSILYIIMPYFKVLNHLIGNNILLERRDGVSRGRNNNVPLVRLLDVP